MKKRKKGLLNYFSRDYWVQIGLFLLIFLVAGRLVVLQVVQASNLQAKGIERRTTDKRLHPKRGSIYDAQGNVLAQSIPVKEVYADPKTLSNLIAQKKYKDTKEHAAQELAEILGLNPQDILGKLNKDLLWISLAHQVDLQKADQIMALKIPGVGTTDEEKRVYPMGNLASAALGIVNLEGHGAEGIESYYDKALFGKPGFQSVEQDTRARSIFETADQLEPSHPGNSLVLTLDSAIQYSIEQQLDSLQQNTKANSVTILAMDPMSGRILGLGSRPTFDPTNYLKSSPEERRNLAISMSYEPGSTFKIITGSSALEEGVVSPDETFPDPGYLRVGPRLITNWDSDQKPHGNPTLTEGMQLSSNVVLAQVGLKLTKRTFFTYLKAFGFGAKTGVDIRGEESGLLVPQENVRDLELATMSFGQANLVTPIQLLTAISAVANGGTLYRPYIVDKIVAQDGEVVQELKSKPIRQVISKATAVQMTNILEQVVSAGTGHLAQIPGINVAGKTGTAQKVDPRTGGYSTTDFIASFAAFAPAENPKIAVLVIIDTPKSAEGHQGGTLGGPPAKAIIEGALQYFGIPSAKDTLSTVSISSGDSQVRPSPQPVIPERSPGVYEAIIPDLTGMTMRQAGDLIAKSGLHFDFTGSGLVVQQNPLPGKVVSKGSTLEIKFSPLTP
ncbi:cell division protein FtsI/penicillin-binding protein 2 [Desulfosporosinus acidiphilus SJ4]|uniref:Cell division protein FtsI/penicillin-binding protein 2 n=1 Tax=Desulfosporosinus acidiphilus (strain DSM 22704 / JCM 16185 / SJ4) TaxID=646529 RepID=I4D7S8_DESAJ|nr:penicillin-binding transpeptidase domain-containing protein [Desulfosporosinus acidiphilus]AFM41852.1 cell division protein FtsI/penicillin-binding protein 2 [Desulfosporosinus acidiphilus SJ4]